MVVRIVISGEAQCYSFAQACKVADYLSQNLPDFCFKRIEKSVLEWKDWLQQINTKNNWHHITSPLIWKEILLKGSKPYYIGDTSQFLEYCYSYYKFDAVYLGKISKNLVKNFEQFEAKVEVDNKLSDEQFNDITSSKEKQDLCVSITGAGFNLSMNIISDLLELEVGGKSISKIFIHDENCPHSLLENLAQEFSYANPNYFGRVVKHVTKLGRALANSDFLIVLDHIPFEPEHSIGSWLHKNKKVMESLAFVLNSSASRNIRILFAGLGPACYNATVLTKLSNINEKNVVVATSGLGLNIIPLISEAAEVPVKNIFCPPVWGFVGINHLVDIRTTIHKYNSFKPYERYAKVKDTTLCCGSLSSEFRTMDYLLHFDDTIWKKAAQIQKVVPTDNLNLNHALAIKNISKLWLFGAEINEIVNLGVKCDGSFGLTFNGIFSQPARFEGGIWKPASDYLLPRDPQMKLSYLEQMAKITMEFKEKDLPPIYPYCSCMCKRITLGLI